MMLVCKDILITDKMRVVYGPIQLNNTPSKVFSAQWIGEVALI